MAPVRLTLMIDRLQAALDRLADRGTDVEETLADVGARSVSLQFRLATAAKVAMAALVVTGGTIALLGLGTGPAFAASLTASDVSISTNDGNITAVTLNPTLAVSWQGLDEPVEQVLVQVKISNSSGDPNGNVLDGSQFLDCAVESHPDCGETSGNTTFDYGNEDINILNKSRYTFRNNATLFDAEDFAAADGETETTPVFVTITARADMTDGSSQFYNEQLSFNVSVTNEGSTVSAEGSLNTGVTG